MAVKLIQNNNLVDVRHNYQLDFCLRPHEHAAGNTEKHRIRRG